MIPGLSGDTQETYLTSMAREGRKYGYKVVIINYRGGAGIFPTSPKLYCASSSEDFREAINYIYDKHC